MTRRSTCTRRGSPSRVQAEGRVRFRDIFTPPYFKARLIGIFLAVLEVIRNHGIGLDQPDGEGGEIWLVRVEEGADK